MEDPDFGHIAAFRAIELVGVVLPLRLALIVSGESARLSTLALSLPIIRFMPCDGLLAEDLTPRHVLFASRATR